MNGENTKIVGNIKVGPTVMDIGSRGFNTQLYLLPI